MPKSVVDHQFSLFCFMLVNSDVGFGQQSAGRVKRLNEKMVATIRLAEAHEASVIGDLTERAYRVDGFLNVEGSEAYAEQLMSAADKHAKNLGLGFIVLSAESPMFAAHRLYEKLQYSRRLSENKIFFSRSRKAEIISTGIQCSISRIIISA